jgi:hypothetical protein
VETKEAEENKDDDGDDDGDDDEHPQFLTLVIVHSNNTCHSCVVKTHRSSSSKEWLDGAVAR